MATIKDVAREAGVSVSTASVALSGKGPVSEATRERVVRAASLLKYRPNDVARSLVTRRTRAIGLVVSDLSDPYFHEIARGVEGEVSSADYTVVLADTDRSAAKERRSIDTLIGRHVDGLVLAGSGDDHDGRLSFLEEGVDPPVVAVGKYGIDVPYVTVDNRKAALLATRHLLEEGCTLPAYVGGPAGYTVSKDRYAGFVEGLEERGRACPGEYRTDADFTPMGGYLAFSRMLDRIHAAGLPLPDGVLAANDQMAFGVIKAAKEHGLRIPHELSVAGIGDIPTAVFVDPPLTTVTLPLKEMGRAAARLILDILERGPKRAQSATFDVKLEVRASTRRRSG